MLEQIPEALVPAKVAEAEANARKAHAEAAVFEADAAVAAIDLLRAQEKRDRELVTDERMHIYRFNEPVTFAAAEKCMSKLAEWSRLAPQCEIEIVFTSPGGSVLAGLALYDFIRDLQGQGHVFTTKSLAFAASMAGILLQVGDHRIMAKESWLLIHEGSAGASGSMGEIEDTVDWYKRIDERILDIFFERTHQAQPKKPLSRAVIKKRYRRKDWWLSSDEALLHGFCDEIA